MIKKFEAGHTYRYIGPKGLKFGNVLDEGGRCSNLLNGMPFKCLSVDSPYALHYSGEG